MHYEEAELIRKAFTDNHPQGESDQSATSFYKEIIRQFNFNEQKIVFIVVPHMVHTLAYFLEALTALGVIAAIIPKASQYVPGVEETFNEIYKSIIRRDINKEILNTEPDKIRLFLKEIYANHPNCKLMIIDHGGYFASRLDVLSEFTERLAGIVEHTWNGELKYHSELQTRPIGVPVFSIARTRLKAYEDAHVARSIIVAMEGNIFSGAGISQDLVRLKIGIIGYGHMGEAIANELANRKVPKHNIIIYDKDDIRFSKAKIFGYHCSENMESLLGECNVIIAAASTKILGRSELGQMKRGACVVCVTSGDDQFKTDYLYGLEKTCETRAVTTYKRPTGDNIYFACGGRSINFSIGSTPSPVLHAVLASVCVSAFNCASTYLTAPSSAIRELREHDIFAIINIYEDKFGPIDQVEVLTKRLKDQAKSEVEQDIAMTQGFTLFTPIKATKVNISLVKDYENYTDDIDEFITQFIISDKNKILLLQGHAGSSKSLFGKKLEDKLWREHQLDDPIVLFIPLAQIRRLDDDLVVQCLELKGLKPEEILLLKDKEFLIFLDGFDEIKGKPNLIKELTKNYSCKIIVASRLGYLNDDDDHLFKANDRENLTKIYITPFDETRVRDYIQRYSVSVYNATPEWDAEKYRKVLYKFPELKDLIKEPLILQLTLSALPNLEQQKKITRYDIYQEFTVSHCRRQIEKIIQVKDERLNGCTLDEAIRVIDDYAKDLAFTLWKEGGQVAEWLATVAAGSQRRQQPRLKIGLADIAKKTDEYNINPYKRLLVSDDDETRRGLELGQHGAPVTKLSKYRIIFSHKTFQEFYTAKMIVEELKDLERVENRDESIEFIKTCSLNQKLITLNDRSIVRLICDNIPQWMLALTEEYDEELPMIRDEIRADGTAIASASGCITKSADYVFWLRRQLFKIVHSSKRIDTISIASANAMTLLNAAKVSFSGMDLAKIKISGAILINAIFYNANLFGSDLRCVNLSCANLVNCSLQDSMMEGVIFSEYPGMYGHDKAITCLDILLDGTIVSGSKDGTIRIWDWVNSKCLRILRGSKEQLNIEITILKELANGSLLYAVESSCMFSKEACSIYIWDRNAEHFSQILAGHAGPISCVGLLSNDSIVSGSLDETVRIWSLNTGNCLHVLYGHTKSVACLAVLTDGTILSGSQDTTIRRWDSKTGKCLKIFRGHTNTVKLINIFEDNIIISGSEDYTVRIWNLQTSECLRIFKGHKNEITCVQLLPEGNIVSASFDKTLKIWDIKSGECLLTLQGHTDHVTSINILSGGSIISGSRDNTIREWNRKNGQCLNTMWVDSSGGIRVLDNNTIIAGNRLGPIYSYSLEQSKRESLQIISGHTTIITALQVISDGIIASASGNIIRIWDMQTGCCLQILEGHTNCITSIALLCDGRIASGGDDKTIRIWNSLTGECLQKFIVRQGDQNTLIAGLLDGSLIVTQSMDPMIWDTKTQSCTNILTGHAHMITELKVLKDGSIISGNIDGTIRIWNSKTGKCVQIFKQPKEEPATSIFELADGRLISGGWHGTLLIWDRIRGECLKSLKQHSDQIMGIGSFGNGIIISASRCHVIGIWNIETSQCRQTVIGHIFSTIDFSLSGVIIIGTIDGSIKYLQYIKEQFIVTGEISGTETSLSCENTNIAGVTGISCPSRLMLIQRGAKDEGEQVDSTSRLGIRP